VGPHLKSPRMLRYCSKRLMTGGYQVVALSRCGTTLALTRISHAHEKCAQSADIRRGRPQKLSPRQAASQGGSAGASPYRETSPGHALVGRASRRAAYWAHFGGGSAGASPYRETSPWHALGKASCVLTSFGGGCLFTAPRDLAPSKACIARKSSEIRKRFGLTAVTSFCDG
jgi:hypothetical protein